MTIICSLPPISVKDDVDESPDKHPVAELAAVAPVSGGKVKKPLKTNTE